MFSVHIAYIPLNITAKGFCTEWANPLLNLLSLKGKLSVGEKVLQNVPFFYFDKQVKLELS